MSNPDPGLAAAELYDLAGLTLPDDGVLRKLIPWLHDPLDFVTTIDELRLHHRLIAQLPAETMQILRVGRSREGQSIAMPWLDLDQADFVAICWQAGGRTGGGEGI